MSSTRNSGGQRSRNGAGRSSQLLVNRPKNDAMSDVVSERRKAKAPTRRRGKILGAVVSLAILAVIYWKIDMSKTLAVFGRADTAWLIVAVGLIAPLTVLMALRFFLIVPRGTLPNVPEAIRLTLVANALNLVIPAKLGDLAKSYFITKRGDATPGLSVAVIVLERIHDLFCICTFV